MDDTVPDQTPTPIGPGRVLASYEIVGKLGTGGMGTVWRARDTKLDREVAIKVLPPDFANDKGRLQRFQREAKTLASLNHPNIAGIHGIDEVDGTLFLVLELVPGEDLSDRLTRGRLPVDEAISVCLRVAEAIETAHEQGVVHRDLKPANVRIMPDDRVKVLDFGLAKLVQPKTATGATTVPEDLDITRDGALLGTPPYMSPEQVRAKPVDRRADIWAFGCLLYECLTGRRAFDGATTSDVLAGILEREPDWSKLPAATPTHVRVLLRRCLDKRQDTRLQDAGEARVALATSSMPGSTPDLVLAQPLKAHRFRPILLLFATAVGGLAVALALFALRPKGVPPNPLANAVAVRLTDQEGNETDADISPDGLFITYCSDRAGSYDIWVEEIDGGIPRNLTRGSMEISLDNIRNVGFGRNGSRVWGQFMASDGDALTQWAPRTGGDFEPLPLRSDVVSADWTRDGSRVVFQTSAGGDPIYVRGSNDPESPAITDKPNGTHQHFPVWSFDEDWILLVRGDPTKYDMNLWRMRPDGSQEEQLTTDQLNVGFPTPINEDTVLFTARGPDGSGPWIWSIDLSSKVTERVSVGLEHYTSLAASADGRRVVATAANPKAALWQVPIPGASAPPRREEDASVLTNVPSLRALSPQYGGDSLFYESSGGAGDGLWTLQDDRPRPVWSNARGPLLYRPSVSTDGSRVALVRRKGSRMQLSVLRTDTRAIVRDLDPAVDVRGGSAWSPDGQWIVAGGIGPDDKRGLFRFPVNGGSAQLMVTGSATDPIWSPTEDLIVYCSKQSGPFRELLVLRDGTPSALSDRPLHVRVELACTRFLPDGSGLVYMDVKDRGFWLLDLATGQTRRLAELEANGAIRSFDVSPDGRSIVFDRVQQNSDVVLFNRPG